MSPKICPNCHQNSATNSSNPHCKNPACDWIKCVCGMTYSWRTNKFFKPTA